MHFRVSAPDQGVPLCSINTEFQSIDVGPTGRDFIVQGQLLCLNGHDLSGQEIESQKTYLLVIQLLNVSVAVSKLRSLKKNVAVRFLTYLYIDMLLCHVLFHDRPIGYYKENTLLWQMLTHSKLSGGLSSILRRKVLSIHCGLPRVWGVEQSSIQFLKVSAQYETHCSSTVAVGNLCWGDCNPKCPSLTQKNLKTLSPKHP